MIRKISVFTLVFLMSFSIAFADTSEEVILDNLSILNYAEDLSAIQSLENTLEISQSGITSAKIAVLGMENSIERLRDFGIPMSKGMRMQYELLTSTLMDKTLNGLESLEMTIESTTNQLHLAGRNLTMMYENNLALYEIEKESFLLSEEEYNSQMLKYELGLISETDKLEAEYDYLVAQSDLNSAQRSMESSRNTLLSTLEIDLDVSLEVVPEVPYSYKDYDVDLMVSMAHDNRPEVQSVENNLDIYAREIEIYVKYPDIINYKPNSQYNTYRNLVFDYREAEMQIGEVKDTVETEIVKALAEYKTNYNNMVSMKNSLDDQQIRLSNMKLQYEAGLLTERMYKEFQLTVMGLEAQYNMLVRVFNTSGFNLYYLTQSGAGSTSGM